MYALLITGDANTFPHWLSSIESSTGKFPLPASGYGGGVGYPHALVPSGPELVVVVVGILVELIVIVDESVDESGDDVVVVVEDVTLGS